MMAPDSGRIEQGVVGLWDWPETMAAEVSQDVVARFVEACREVGRRGLVRCSSGNLSQRIDGGRMLVTATRSWLGRLTADDVSLCRIEDGACLDGRRPTVEVNLHAGILRARPEMNVALHFQSPCATTLACRDSRHVNFFVIPEIPFYIGPIGHVPYLPPGSLELADATVEALRNRNLALMANHGQVTVARDLDHAIQNAEFFELACQIIIEGGDKVTPLSNEAARALMALGLESNRRGV
jgi:ribulose-5-phosphate 4-epimerase/fuculose-1-phosphate aldolase